MDNKKTVSISGSNRGIGKATAELFAQRGWNVIVHARQSTDEFESFVRKLAEDNHVTIIPVYFDMRDETAMKAQWEDETLYRHGLLLGDG